MEQTPQPYISNPFELIKPSWTAFKLCWANLLLIVLATFGVFVALVVIFFALTLLGKVGNILVFLLALPLMLYAIGTSGWASTKVTLAAARGLKLNFRQTLPTHWADPFKYLFTGFLAGIAVLGGLILLIIPGIIFGAWFSTSTYIAVDEGTYGFAALGRSRELVRGRVWDTLGTAFLPSIFTPLTIIPILGTIALLISNIVLSPAFSIRYNFLIKLKQQDGWQSVPTSRWNYLVLAFGLLFNGVSTTNSINTTIQNQAQMPKNIRAY